MSTLDSSALVDSKAYQRPEEIRELLKSLRHTAPVSLVTPEGYRPFWAISKYSDIKHIESSPELFSAEPRTILIDQVLEERNLARFGDIHGVKTLVHMDGDEHKKLRNVTRNWFMPKNISLLRGKVDVIAAEFVDRLRMLGGECDFANDLAFWYPLRVVLQLIGIPESDESKMLRLTQRLFAPDSYVVEGKDSAAIFGETVQEMVEYFTSLAEIRRQSPKNDIASVVANAVVDGNALDPFTLTSYFVILATAGHDTTSACIAGGMQALIEYPEQQIILLENTELYSKFADEAIRWTSPVKHFVRTALTDTSLSGVNISKGESVAMFFESGNRDEEFYSNPDCFDVRRENNRHVAFGFGRHSCLGMHLARVEIESFFRRLLPMLKSVELSGAPKYIESNFVSGLSSLPIRYEINN